MEPTISNPMIGSTVQKYIKLGYLYQKDSRRFLTLVPCSILVGLQLIYMFFSHDELDRFALNMYFGTLLSNCLFRAIYTSIHSVNFQENLESFSRLYEGVLKSSDEFARKEVKKATYWAKVLKRINICILIGATSVYLSYLLTAQKRILLYGIYTGGVNVQPFPIYEITLLFEFLHIDILNLMYILFLEIYFSFLLMGFALIRILSHNFEVLAGDFSDINNENIFQRLRRFVEFHNRLIRYVDGLNEIFSTMFLMEIILFGLLLLTMTFFLMVVDKISQSILVISILLMVFFELFIVYWMSNEVIEQSARLQFAIYNTPWYDFDTKNKKIILLMLCTTQQPLQIMIGNFAPMTLHLFQSILNGTYSYFTILRRTFL